MEDWLHFLTKVRAKIWVADLCLTFAPSSTDFQLYYACNFNCAFILPFQLSLLPPNAVRTSHCECIAVNRHWGEVCKRSNVSNISTTAERKKKTARASYDSEHIARVRSTSGGWYGSGSLVTGYGANKTKQQFHFLFFANLFQFHFISIWSPFLSPHIKFNFFSILLQKHVSVILFRSYFTNLIKIHLYATNLLFIQVFFFFDKRNSKAV